MLNSYGQIRGPGPGGQDPGPGGSPWGPPGGGRWGVKWKEIPPRHYPTGLLPQGLRAGRKLPPLVISYTTRPPLRAKRPGGKLPHLVGESPFFGLPHIR